MKKILGLDLGTNSIGWAIVKSDFEKKEGEILGIGSRIIPMTQDVLGKFDAGVSVSQTAERTSFRSVRRLRERHLLRRERLHRVLNLLGFLPHHYQKSIDFENHFGKFLPGTEPKIAWNKKPDGSYDFVFKDSFNEMAEDFKNKWPDLFQHGKSIPYDWTIYFLRQKALREKIDKEELAWLLLNFNQKRGYYQLRGEEEEERPDKVVEYHELKVVEVTADPPRKGKEDIWYNIVLENGWIYRRSSKTPLYDWKGKLKEFIVTTDLNADGTIKIDKEGKEKRSFRAPSEDDWSLLKKKTESDIEKSQKTVGAYIYEKLLQNPNQKINGKLVRTIERKFYKNELVSILKTQKEFHAELNDNSLFEATVFELYPNNEAHRKTLFSADFTKLFVDDIIFFQRPLKSKKSQISNCKFEFRQYKDKESGAFIKVAVKGIPKSHPLYQEFRLWKFVRDLRIYEREKLIDGKTCFDYDVTNEFLPEENDRVAVFEYLNQRKEIKQDVFLTNYLKLSKKKAEGYRWNFVEDKIYPCNETRSLFKNLLLKAGIDDNLLVPDFEKSLWHILYSIKDKKEIEKALGSFARRHNLDDNFIEVFKKAPPFKQDYGAYSEKAIKKLLPLMRMGKYWSKDAFHVKTMDRINKIIDGEYDETIRERVRNKAINLKDIQQFRGLPEWLASYIVYDRHAESGDVIKWNSPEDIDNYLREEFQQHSLRNPIVEQVVTETLRVVRDVWKKYGDFSEIHVELGREMKNPADKRERMSKKIAENENANLRIKAMLTELMEQPEISGVRAYSPSHQEKLKIYEDGVLNSGVEVPDDILKISRLAQPKKNELTRYTLWLQQKYRSPYTGEVIPLGKLFTSEYQIEHVIPQSRYFDNSLSNKVICESVVNGDPYKDNQLGFEFILKNEGRIVPELSNGSKTVRIFNKEEYENFVKQHYSKNPLKMKKLLMDEIPEQFIERQLNDSRYISKVVKGLLSNIVREPNEEDAISKNVIPCAGGVTSILKQEFGLNDVWNKIITPRFERMNELTKSNQFGYWDNKDGKKIFQIQIPLEMQKGFNKKRIDHRHHALDALVIACATRSHINYLNNKAALKNARESRYDLKNKLCYKHRLNGNGSYSWQFHKPWPTFTEDANSALQKVIVSFKQNLRVINKNVNNYQRFVDGKKVVVKQLKGENWAIRKPLHKATVAGKVNLRNKKAIMFSAAIDQWENLVDKGLKTKIKQLINDGYDKKAIKKFFSSSDFIWNRKNIEKPEIYYFSDEKEPLVASRTTLDSSFTSKKIGSITDTGIQKILLNHLSKYNEVKEGKAVERPDLAFSPEGVEEMNKNLENLNNGKKHQPIYKVRVYEPMGNKFNRGTMGAKSKGFVEAEKGTNLFFAIYWNEQKNKREYETIPLNEVIEHQKLVSMLPASERTPVPVNPEKGKFLFSLSPNDLVYLPNKGEVTNHYELDGFNADNIYKMVSCTGNRCFFIPNRVASLIKNYDAVLKYGEFEALNKIEFSNDRQMIKETCFKLQVDRLGKITKVFPGY